MLILGSLLYLVLLCALLIVAYRPALFHRYYARVKSAVSLGFLLLSVFAALWRGNAALLVLMLPGLLLCFAGDVALGLANTHKTMFRRLFLSGVAAFALAHIAFVAAFALMSPVRNFWQWWMLLPPAALVCGAMLCCHNGAFRLKKLRTPVVLYSACVGAMCAAALRLGVAAGPRSQGIWFAGGALLFVLSDCILLFLYFYVKPRKMLRALNLLTYYLGM
ncbi:MAG: lysoplasmalogenase family protein, partial [Ruthenibacterium sp.]